MLVFSNLLNFIKNMQQQNAFFDTISSFIAQFLEKFVPPIVVVSSLFAFRQTSSSNSFARSSQMASRVAISLPSVRVKTIRPYLTSNSSRCS